MFAMMAFKLLYEIALSGLRPAPVLYRYIPYFTPSRCARTTTVALITGTKHDLDGRDYKGADTVGELEELYLSMRGSLSRMVARIVPPDEVEDIVQETYIRLRRVVVAQEIRHPRSYLYQTARNLALDSIKRADNALSVEWDHDANYSASRSDSVINEIESTANFERFCDSVQNLPMQARRVFVLKKVYGFTQREIATELGISESTVEKHVALGFRRCSRYMGDIEFSGVPSWAGAVTRGSLATA